MRWKPLRQCVPVPRVRYLAAALSGALAALGGVYLALDQHQFTDGMTAGRGFIALAATIFGRWDPVRALLAWSSLYGTISFELFGHFVGSVEDGDRYFDRALTDLARLIVF